MKKQLTKWMAAVALVLIMANVFSGCKKDDDDAKTEEVIMLNSEFDPTALVISAGTTVTWVNKDNMLHTVTASDSSFYSPDMAQNATFSHTFTTAGSYSYYCIYHFGMTGGIIVQ